MLLAVVLLSSLVTAAPPPPPGTMEGQAIALGQATARLNGPWKFHAGDDPTWADPGLDDSGWEPVDLSAAAGAHDADVGLSGYVKGWGNRGHRGLDGYGWYRLHLHLVAPAVSTLALAGPPAVDSAYQIFWNGHLLGGVGDFRDGTPRAFSIQPRLFSIPSTASASGSGTDVLAVRVWMGRWDLADPQGGGIRIAPTLGTSNAVREVYQSEWIETLRGYVVEVIEALGFAGLCLVAWLLAHFDVAPQKYRWLYAALLLTGAYRLNQAIFFWGQFESVPAFAIISPGLLYPLGLAAWTMGWARLLEFKSPLWERIFAGTTALYLGSALLQHAAHFGPAHASILATLHVTTTCCRLFYLVSTGWLLFRVLPLRRRSRWWLGVLIVLVSVGQFAPELSEIGMPGIWFPFGTGVSRAQFAYALFFVVAAIFAWVRLKEIAEHFRGDQRVGVRGNSDGIAGKELPDELTKPQRLP